MFFFSNIFVIKFPKRRREPKCLLYISQACMHGIKRGPNLAKIEITQQKPVSSGFVQKPNVFQLKVSTKNN
jgi:hypothetical protein